MKICSQCKQEKPPTEFFREKRVASGLHAECKECTKAAKARWGKLNAQYAREYSVKYHWENRENRVRQMRKYKHTQHYLRNIASPQAKKDRLKALTHKKVQYALKMGILAKQPCVKCGAKAEAHHPDYSKPLDVIWLCRVHHAEVHRLVRLHARMA